MALSKENVLLEELEIENNILKEKINEIKMKNENFSYEINILKNDIENKENVINTILNSRTFRYADKIGKFLKGKK
mgnify:FL=1